MEGPSQRSANVNDTDNVDQTNPVQGENVQVQVGGCWGLKMGRGGAMFEADGGGQVVAIELSKRSWETGNGPG